MVQALAMKRSTVKSWVLALGMVAAAASLVWPTPAEAHCDSTSGPVVEAARQSLETGDAKPVLAYVKPEAEVELRAAYQQAQEVRQLGGSAQQMADRYFYETAVRLHRQGEGAAYTGLKEISDFGPALTAADEALETGDVNPVYLVVDRTIRAELGHRYEAVLEARHEAAEAGTVEAYRDRAEAELLFEKYVDELYQAALGSALHAEASGAQRDEAH